MLSPVVECWRKGRWKGIVEVRGLWCGWESYLSLREGGRENKFATDIK